VADLSREGLVRIAAEAFDDGPAAGYVVGCSCSECKEKLGALAGALLAALTDDAEGDEARVERLCEVMHDAYEEAAQRVGWETQVRSRAPWSHVPEANKATMRVAVEALLRAESARLRELLPEDQR